MVKPVTVGFYSLSSSHGPFQLPSAIPPDSESSWGSRASHSNSRTLPANTEAIDIQPFLAKQALVSFFAPDPRPAEYAGEVLSDAQ